MVATLHELDEAALIQILTQPKNALTKQFHALFQMEGAELEFKEEALHLIAKKALQRKIGARGLRAIIENTLLSTMYELPSLEGVTNVIIDEKAINGEGVPVLVYKDEDLKQVASGGE